MPSSYRNTNQYSTPTMMAKHLSASNSSTKLADLISNREWDDVATRLQSHPSEASTLVTKDDIINGNTHEILLPLHLAIRSMASCNVIEALIKAHPAGVSIKESSSGMLPLHLACRYGGHPNVVNLLLMHYPKAINIKDQDTRKGKLPMDYATKHKTYPNDEPKVVMVLKRAMQYDQVSAAEATRISQGMENKIEELSLLYDAKVATVEAQHGEERKKLEQAKWLLQSDVRKKDEQIASLREQFDLVKQDRVREVANQIKLSEKLKKTAEEDKIKAESMQTDILVKLGAQEEENRVLQGKIYNLQKELENERSERAICEEELRMALSNATMSLTKANTNLRDRLYTSHKVSVVRELEGVAAASTIDNLTNQIKEYQRIVNHNVARLGQSAETEAENLIRVQELELIVSGNKAKVKASAEAEAKLAARVEELESELKASAENEAKLLCRTSVLEGMVKTTKTTIELLEKKNEALTQSLEEKDSGNSVSSSSVTATVTAKANAAFAAIASSVSVDELSNPFTLPSAISAEREDPEHASYDPVKTDIVLRSASNISLGGSPLIEEQEGLVTIDTMLVDNTTSKSKSSSHEDSNDDEVCYDGDECRDTTENISRDGTLSGENETQLKNKSENSGLPLIAENQEVFDQGQAYLGLHTAGELLETVDFPKRKKKSGSFSFSPRVEFCL